MSELSLKKTNAGRRTFRVRSRTRGTAERPRLSVKITNLHVTAQIIDDSAGKTLAYASTVGQKAAAKSKLERSEWVGTEIAKKAKAAKVKTVVFDRGSRLYHGRIKALAEAARKEGLEF